MAYTYGDLATEIQNEVDDQTSDAQTTIKQNINDICEEIWQEEDWQFKEATAYLSTVSGQQVYPLAPITDLGKIGIVSYKGDNQTSFAPIGEVTFETFRATYNDAVSTAPPFRWALYDEELYLFPTPDYSGTDNLQIDYNKKWVELDDNDDIPSIPVKYKRVIKAGVKALFWHYDDDLRETPAWQHYIRMLGTMRTEELDRTTTPKRFRLFRA